MVTSFPGSRAGAMMEPMVLRNLIALLALALFAGTGAHAQAQNPHDAPPPLERPSQRGSQLEPLARGQMNAPLPTDRPMNDRYFQRRSDRYAPQQQRQVDPMQQRYETLRNRYSNPPAQEYGRDLHQAVETARRRHGGKVLSAERMQMDGRDGYRVKLLTPSGRVRIVQMPNPEVSPTPEEQQGEQ